MDGAALKGDATTLGWVWARIAHTFSASAAADVRTKLEALAAATEDDDAEAVATMATEIRTSVAGSGWQ
jgi:hypothetical protein